MLRIALIFLFLAAIALPQSDAVNGKWMYTMDTPDGQVPVTLELKVDGKQVTGFVSTGPERRFKIENGTFEDGVVKVTVKRDRPSGGVMTYQLSGKVEGSVMKGTTVADMNGEKVTQEWEAKKQ